LKRRGGVASLIFIYPSIIDTHHGCGAKLFLPGTGRRDSKEEKTALAASGLRKLSLFCFYGHWFGSFLSNCNLTINFAFVGEQDASKCRIGSLNQPIASISRVPTTRFELSSCPMSVELRGLL
jgi:hypothetical protein